MSNNSTAVSNVIPFDFRGDSIRAVSISGVPWFVASDVCRVLDVTNTTQAVQSLDDDERSMFNIGRQGQANVVNESGLYTLILRSRDAVKKGSKPHAFRKWVTAEVLPSIREQGHYIDQHAVMGDLVGAVIGTSGEHVLDRVIDQKASPVPHSLQRSFKHTMKSRLRSRFNVQRTALIPAENLSDACNFVVAYALEGEWIGREISPSDKVNWSAQRWLQESPAYVQRTMTEMQGRGNMMLTPHMLFGGDSISPTLKAISELEKQGHDLEACSFEVQALKHHLEGAHYTIQSLQMLIERSDGKGVRFPMAQPGHAA